MNQTEQTSRVVVLLFTDIVDSVDMQQRLGTQTYTEILQQHDELFREALDPIPDSVLYQDTGDGQLAPAPPPPAAGTRTNRPSSNRTDALP